MQLATPGSTESSILNPQKSHLLESNQNLRLFRPARRPHTPKWEKGGATQNAKDSVFIANVFNCHRSIIHRGFAAHPGSIKTKHVLRAVQFLKLGSGTGIRTPNCRAKTSRPAVRPSPIVVPLEGVEPPTSRLKAGYATNCVTEANCVICTIGFRFLSLILSPCFGRSSPVRASHVVSIY